MALVEDGMTVGLGTGSTVAYLLPALANRGLTSILCVATSPRTEEAARALGLAVSPFGDIERFDIAIDGADEVTPDGWLIKGGGAAHTREKIVAAAADRFVVIADSSKAVPALRGTVPVEMLAYGLAATMRRLQPIALRDVPRSPDGGVIADYSGSDGRSRRPRGVPQRDAGRRRTRPVSARPGARRLHRPRRLTWSTVTCVELPWSDPTTKESGCSCTSVSGTEAA